MLIRRLVTLLPLFAATAAVGQHAYVTNLDRQSLTVVDLATLSVVVEATTGGLPWQVAVAGERVYASVPGAGTVTVLDTATGGDTTFAVGGTPTGLALDPAGSRLAVTDPSAGLVTLLDALDGSVVATAPIAGEPMAVAMDSAQVYVATYADRTLEILDATSLAPLASITVGRFPTDVVADESLGRAWVTSLFDDLVSVVDTVGGVLVTDVPVAATPASVAFSPSRGEVFVTHRGAGAPLTSVTVIDAATDAVVRTFSTGVANPADVLPSADGSRLLINHLGDSRLVVVDTATTAQVGVLDLGPSHGALAGFTEGVPAPVVIPTLGSLGLVLLAALLALAAWRLLGHRAAVVPALIWALGSVPCEAQSLEILDGDFQQWTSQIEPPGAPGMHLAMRLATGGNPGAFWRMVHSSAVGVSVNVSHRYDGGGGVYDPAVRGAITAIDVSWDRRLDALDGPTAMLEAPAVFQAGEVFVAGDLAFATLDVWEPVSLPGLTATAFTGMVSGSNPDFSAGGAPLAFGFVRRTPDGFADHHLDNFRACVRSVDDGGVPCDGAGDAGDVRFIDTIYIHFMGTPVSIDVERVGGASGAVSIEVASEPTNGPSCTLQWGDGESGTRSCTADLPNADHLVIYRLRLQSATGGVGQAMPNVATLYLSPDQPPYVFLLALIALFSGWQAWGVALLATVSAVAWAARRRAARAAERR